MLALLQSYEAREAAEIKALGAKANGAGKPPARSHSGGPNSKVERIRQATTEYLRDRGPAHRKEILAHLTQLGIMGRETNPLKAIGSYLSRWPDEITSEGAGKWRLRKDL